MACTQGWDLQKAFNEAVHERVEAENAMMYGLEGGTFATKQARFDRSKEQWNLALVERTEHIRTCPTCFADPPGTPAAGPAPSK